MSATASARSHLAVAVAVNPHHDHHRLTVGHQRQVILLRIAACATEIGQSGKPEQSHLQQSIPTLIKLPSLTEGPCRLSHHILRVGNHPGKSPLESVFGAPCHQAPPGYASVQVRDTCRGVAPEHGDSGAVVEAQNAAHARPSKFMHTYIGT